MTLRRVARALVVVLDVVILVASGTYLIVYLYRWEWNRAVVSGVFFVIAEIAMVAIVLLGRLSRLERRLDGAAGPAPSVPAEAWRADRESERPFAWLGDGDAVFVPVLIGVGAILTAIAYVVEHLASATSRPDRTPADPRFAVLDLPADPLAPTALDLGPEDDLEPSRRPPARARVASAVVAGLVGALLLVATINQIAAWTQNRPDPRPDGSATALELLVSVRDDDVSPDRVADALWVSCRGNLPHDVTGSIGSVHGSSIRMRLEPAIGPNARRRFVGCLQDLTVEGALARVTTWRTVLAAEN